MKTHCPEHGEIARSDTVRGFEYSKGQYVVIDEGDFENVPLKTVRSIEIELFVDAERESARRATSSSRPTTWSPRRSAARRSTCSSRSSPTRASPAICKIVLKDREALAAINPYSNTMLLSTLYWPDEVRDTAELDLPEEDFDFKPAEKQMARQLVEA